MARSRSSERVGATSDAVDLGERPGHAVLRTSLPAAEAPRRLYLRVEHLTSEAPAPSYDVYLGVPAGEDPAAHPDKYVGRLASYGLAEASESDGAGLSFGFEVTALVERLRREPGWIEGELPVSFVPVEAAPGTHARVGRVSLQAR